MRNDNRHPERALRVAMRVGLLLVACHGIDALAAKKKDPPGVHATPTGFTVVEENEIDGATRSDFAKAEALLAQQKYNDGIAILQAVADREAQAEQAAKADPKKHKSKLPQLAAVHVDLGIAYGKTDQLDKAEAELRKAVELQPQHPVAWNELGLVLRRKGKFADARAAYEKSLAAAPGFHYARLNLAVLCDIYLDDSKCALDNYLAYQQIVPGDKQVATWIKNAQTRAEKGEK